MLLCSGITVCAVTFSSSSLTLGYLGHMFRQVKKTATGEQTCFTAVVSSVIFITVDSSVHSILKKETGSLVTLCFFLFFCINNVCVQYVQIHTSRYMVTRCKVWQISGQQPGNLKIYYIYILYLLLFISNEEVSLLILCGTYMIHGTK